MEIWEQACEFHRQKKFAEAEALYEQLLTQNPHNSGLLATLGTLYLEINRWGLAIAFLEASMKYGRRQSDVLSNLGIAYRNTGQPDKARACLEESVKLDPSGQALANYAGMHVESDKQDEAVVALRRAIKAEPELAIAHWNLGLIQLAQGKWDTAWDEHEWGLKTNGMRINREIGGVPEWDGKAGKRIIVYGEQGIGDEIMFASMIPDMLAEGNEVILESHERLETLFKRAFPDVTVYGTREQKEPQWPANETADCRVSIGSLGKFYRRSADSFPGTPYLKADAAPRGEKFRVGISWTGGGAKVGRVVKRSVPLSWWKSILNVPNVEFVSLQYTDCQEEIDLVNALGYDIKTDPAVKAHDYYETARLVKSCDLVISVCTSVIHLAGALGVPCWVLTPKNPAWRYQNSGRMPWYRSVRLYRQPEPKVDAWLPVVQRVGLDLDELVTSQRRIQRAA